MPEIDRSGSGRMYSVAHISGTYAHVHLGTRDDGQEVACFNAGQPEFDALGLVVGYAWDRALADPIDPQRGYIALRSWTT